jgi:hypothetical protein
MIASSVSSISVRIAPVRSKKMSSVGDWMKTCGSRPSSTRAIMPETWEASACITIGLREPVTVRMPSGRFSTSRKISSKWWNITIISALSSGVASSPAGPAS